MRLGERQVLTVVKKVDFGVYLGGDEERSLASEETGAGRNRSRRSGRSIPV